MDNANLESILKANFGFDKFRSPQDEIISSIADGTDTLAIMPTGGGKSLCYQLPALILDGVTLVISPLIALMKDQVDALKARGISAAMINSAQSAQEQRVTLDDLRMGNIKLAYVAPERFRAPSFLRALKDIKIALFAVDEAHCISQWGHDFRPDYMRLGEALDLLGHPPCAAFTATATPEVKDDITAQLKMRNPKIFVSGFSRPNLSFNVRQIEKKAEKYMRVCDLIEKYRTGIIYCATRKSAEALSADLEGDRIDHVLYHGGMTPAQRDEAQEIFMGGKKSVAVATNAFGMGIDRADIRFVCHYELTGSVESFYQEAGRAGRDGLPAHCEMLFMYADKRVQEFFIDGANPTPEVIRGVYRILRENADNSYECFMPIENIAEELAEILKFEQRARPAPRFGGAWKQKSSSAASNGMAVSSAISILRSLGFIERFDVAGKRTRGTRLTQPDSDEYALPINQEILAQKRGRDESKLKDVLRFAYAKECRQEWILRYFGERVSSPCGACDNCKNGDVAKLSKLSENQIQEVRKALSGIARMSRRITSTNWEARFGREKIVKCLLGSKDERLTSSGLDTLSTYGILKEHGKKFVSSLFDAMIDCGLVEIIEGDYPLATLTPLGAQVMLGSAECPPMDYPAGESKAKSYVSKESKPQKLPRRTTATISEEIPEEDRELFAMLVAKRNLLRHSMNNIAAFKIFPNLVLQQLAQMRPQTKEEAMQVKGIGEVKAEKFLPPFLEIIKGYTQE